jgi:hypothetical protein
MATDMYSFENLIKRGYTYVDKAGLIYSLINKSPGGKFYLPRLRRSGKSTFISVRVASVGVNFDFEKHNFAEWTAEIM